MEEVKELIETPSLRLQDSLLSRIWDHNKLLQADVNKKGYKAGSLPWEID